MAFDFPNSPTVGQVYNSPITGVSYTWDGQKWGPGPTGSGSGGTSVTISDTPPASPSAGNLWWESDTGNLYIYFSDANSSQWVMASVLAPVGTVMRSHLAGLTMSTPGASANFTVQPGVAADSTNSVMMTLPAAITKNMSAWVVGAGGALDTGAISVGNFYDVNLIRRPDTGVVDVLLTLAGNAPTLPANYTQFRRIGSLWSFTASTWFKFIQTGDEFLWDAPAVDVANQAVGVSGFFATAVAPPNCEAILQAVMQSNTVNIFAYFHSLLANAAVVANTPFYQLSVQAAGGISAATMRVRLNATRQYRVVSNATAATCNVWISTIGWIDRRGRDA